MFRTNFTRILDEIAKIEKRFDAIETTQQEVLKQLAEIRSELSQAEDVQRLQMERQRLADQGMQLVEQLEAARRELHDAKSK
ncbi:MAG: hypothetical protein AAF196_00485 [Planctomycetota bacterium]